jgi:hypothetical protein
MCRCAVDADECRPSFAYCERSVRYELGQFRAVESILSPQPVEEATAVDRVEHCRDVEAHDNSQPLLVTGNEHTV